MKRSIVKNRDNVALLLLESRDVIACLRRRAKFAVRIPKKSLKRCLHYSSIEFVQGRQIFVGS